MTNEYIWSFSLGALTGFIYFGALWATVNFFAKSKSYWLFPISFLIRFALLALVFLFLLPKSLTGILLFVLAIVLARVVMVKALQAKEAL